MTQSEAGRWKTRHCGAPFSSVMGPSSSYSQAALGSQVAWWQPLPKGHWPVSFQPPSTRTARPWGTRVPAKILGWISPGVTSANIARRTSSGTMRTVQNEEEARIMVTHPTDGLAVERRLDDPGRGHRVGAQAAVLRARQQMEESPRRPACRPASPARGGPRRWLSAASRISGNMALGRCQQVAGGRSVGAKLSLCSFLPPLGLNCDSGVID